MDGHQSKAVEQFIDNLIEGEIHERQKKLLTELRTDIVPWNTIEEILERIQNIYKGWTVNTCRCKGTGWITLTTPCLACNAKGEDK